MGNYSKQITERIKHTRIKEGFCLICGEYGKLSQDHVPPKGAITISLGSYMVRPAMQGKVFDND